MSCGVGCRLCSDLTLLWLWCRPAALALINPLAWEPPYASSVALEKIFLKKVILERKNTHIQGNRQKLLKNHYKKLRLSVVEKESLLNVEEDSQFITDFLNLNQ